MNRRLGKGYTTQLRKAYVPRLATLAIGCRKRPSLANQ
jgi:hypothetical protein